MAKRRPNATRNSRPVKRTKGRGKATPASADSVVAAGVVLWGNLFAEAATYALATNRELIAMASGRADPRSTMLRLGDLGQQYLERLANIPRQVAEQFGVEIPASGSGRRRQGHPTD